MLKALVIDPGKCTGCKQCEMACSYENENEFNVANSTPILKTGHGSYILLQQYSLLEALYETWANSSQVIPWAELENKKE